MIISDLKTRQKIRIKKSYNYEIFKKSIIET